MSRASWTGRRTKMPVWRCPLNPRGSSCRISRELYGNVMQGLKKKATFSCMVKISVNNMIFRNFCKKKHGKRQKYPSKWYISPSQLQRFPSKRINKVQHSTILFQQQFLYNNLDIRLPHVKNITIDLSFIILLHVSSGVPAVVDFAAMRDAVKRLGGDPQKINPVCPSDLVIDHSVQVDVSRR